MKTNRKHTDLQIESLEPMVLMSASAADVEGDDADNALVGQPGDTVNGGGGDDLIAGVQDNTLCGGDGNDLFTTGDGYNTVDGEAGYDTIQYATLNRADVSVIVRDDGSVEISDGNKTDIISNVETFEFKDLTLSLADLQNPTNTPPVIETNDHLTIAENQTEVGTIVASDTDGDALHFSLSDAQDGNLFVIDPDTGVLSFKVAPDFENPNSVNGTNVYDVTVRVSDCDTTTLKTFWVTVTDVDESGSGGDNSAPTFDNLDANEVIDVNEGTIDVRDIDASDVDGDTITYSFADALNTPGDGPNQDPGLFNLDPNTGELSFKVAPDFDNPADADGNNEYLVTIVISDGTHSVERDITIRVQDVNTGGNQAPSFTNVPEGGQATVVEGNTFVDDTNGTDPDGDTLTFSIVGGDDSGQFSIDAATGVVTFVSPPDFENPEDSNTDNVYELTLRVSDGDLFQDRNVTVQVLDRFEGGDNNHPYFTNVEQNEQVTVLEGNTFVGDANGTDPNGDSVTYSISGGVDSEFFNIDPTTGILTFKNTPDFENPADADGNNVYSLTLRISDGTLYQERDITVKVLDVNEGGDNNHPYFTNVEQNEQVTVLEGNTFVGDANGTDPNGDSVTYSIAGGVDSEFFNIDPTTGILTFKNAPDFENPADADGNNVYSLTLRISDGTLYQERDITVKVLDVNEGGNNNHPYFTNVEQNEQVTVLEGNTFVGDANGTDPNGDSVTYSIAGGVDSEFFNIDPTTGILTFKNAPDFENPADADGNNVYSLTLRISDGTLYQERDITVKVLDVNEGGNNNHPYFTNVEQNEQVTVLEGNTFVGDANGTDPNGDSVTYSISGGVDSEFFNIDPTTGILTFKNAPDFENPADADGNNVYSLTLRISDGTLYQERDITVKVLDVNEGGDNNHPYFTNVEQNEQVTVLEGNTFVGDANGTDPNGDSVTYSIAGGVDSEFFNIDPTTGILTFKNAPDFENPADADGNNVYSLTLRISDGTLYQERDITVKVLDVNEGGDNNHPYFTNVEQNEQVTVLEGNTFVGDANGTDPNGDSVTYSIAGGVDSEFFNIDPTTGILTFKNAPDFENPADADGNNVYSLTLRISDGTLYQERDITVRVLDVNEGGNNNHPYFTNVEQNEQVTVLEGNTFVGDANGTDPNGDSVTYSIAGGVDSEFFNIDPTTGILTFKNAPDFENPADADGNNVYSLTLRISDGTLYQERDITVRVLDRNEGGSNNNNAPFFTNVSQNEVVWHNENATLVGDANAADPDGDQLTFSIAGGADSSFFQINAQTGQLFFINAPDFENPQDADGNNLYVVVLRVSDGIAFQDRTVIVNVENLVNG